MKRKILGLAIHRDLDLPINILSRFMRLLPEDTCLVSSGYEIITCSDYLFFKSEKFEEVPPGNQVPIVILEVTTEGDLAVKDETGKVIACDTNYEMMYL